MNRCSDYEIELSALVDGESDPATALKLIEHVAACSSCSAFVRELRSTQDIVDSLQLAPEPDPEPVDVLPIELRRRRVFGLRPQWAIGIAAMLIVTVGVWLGSGVSAPLGFTNDLRDGELVIRLEEDKGRMSDERFVALVSELLRADRRYQNEMFLVLNELSNNGASGESRSNRSGEHDRDESTESYSPLTAAME